MRIEFNVTGAKRKELASAISEFMGEPAEYQYMPTCAYKIADFTIAKEGALESDEPLTEERLGKLMEFLSARGFTTTEAPTTGAIAESEEVTETAEETPQSEKLGLTIGFPIETAMVGNLTRLLEAKGSLIKKALNIEAIPVEVTEDKVNFP